MPQLRQVAPDLVVHRGTEPQAWSEVWGARTPAWVGLARLGLLTVTLGLLVSGPAPRRATRWAWFWVFWLPGGQLAFLVLSVPAPLLSAPGPRARRLTGGWAFLGLLVVKALTWSRAPRAAAVCAAAQARSGPSRAGPRRLRWTTAR